MTRRGDACGVIAMRVRHGFAGDPMETIIVTSSAFRNGGTIPARFTCDGPDVSPPLSWTGVPAGAKGLALICDDPDAPAGDWVHWVMYDIPPSTTALAENQPTTQTLPGGAKQGVNDFRKIGYGGPCPPGGTHRYFFTIYALDIALNLEPGKTKAELLRALQGHIVAQGQLMGAYTRTR